MGKLSLSTAENAENGWLQLEIQMPPVEKVCERGTVIGQPTLTAPTRVVA